MIDDKTAFERSEKTERLDHLRVSERPEMASLIDGRYRVAEILATGDYRVIHLGVEQNFRLRLTPTLAQGSRAQRMVQDVAQASGLLGHEALGFVTDIGFDRRYGSYVVSEYVQGSTLKDLIAAGRQLELEEALRFALQIGGAVATLHEFGVVHGLFRTTDIILSENQRWKLIGAGIPAAPNAPGPYVAPEVSRYRDATPSTDQFALASFIYQLLVGAPPEGSQPFEPSTLRADVPPEVDDVLLRARSYDKAKRFDSTDAFLEELHSAFKVWQEPTLSPFDAREASRMLAHPGGFERTPSKRSMVVSIERVAQGPSVLAVEFGSAARLKREYRRNIVARALFVPLTHKSVELDDEVRVQITYQPSAAVLELDARVATVHEGAENHPAGVGVVFDVEAHERLLEFVRTLNLGLGLRPHDRLEVVAELSRDATVSAAEAYLYSRMQQGPTTVARARASVSGLPFEFEEALQALVARGLVRAQSVETTPGPETPGRPHPETPDPVQQSENRAEVARPADDAPKPPEESEEIVDEAEVKDPVDRLDSSSFSVDDTEYILEVATHLEEARNYMSALEILRRGLENDPGEARFHDKVARLRAEFFEDFAGGLRSIARAIKLDPNRQEYRETKRKLVRLREQHALRPVFETRVDGFRFRLIRHDPELHRMWVEAVAVEGAERRLLAVDTGRRKILQMTTASRSTMRVVAANDLSVRGFENRVPTAFKTLKARRKQLIENVRQSSDYGPYFRVGPEPVAWTENSTFLVFDRDPRGGSRGLFIVQEDVEAALHRVDPGSREGRSPVFSHDETRLAWVRVEPEPAICVARPFEDVRVLLELKSVADLTWSDDATQIFAVSHSGTAYVIDPESGENSRWSVGLSEIDGVRFDPGRRWAVAWSEHDSTTKLALIDFEGEALAGEMQIKTSGAMQALVRDDGIVALSHESGLSLIDARNSKVRSLELLLAEGSLDRNHWLKGRPLILMRGSDDLLELVELDAESFGF